MDLKLLFGILILSVLVLFLSFIIIFIFSLPFLIRSLRIKNLAKDYGLLFKSNIKLKLLEPREEKINICEGYISGKHIEVFDHIDYGGFSVSPLNKNTKISSRATVIIIDGERKQIRDNTLFGYARISSIRRVLSSLGQKETLSKYLSSDSNRNIPITYAFFVIVIVITFIIWITKFISSQ